MVNGAVVDELLARTSSGGTTAWYLTDKLDSVRDIVSSSGSVLDHVVYDSFGNIVTETNASNGDRFKFAGMEYDPATLQYYDRARDYKPAIGRFTSLDPLGFHAGDTDLYRYVTNGPTDVVDQSGMGVFPPSTRPPGKLDPGFLDWILKSIWNSVWPPEEFDRSILPNTPQTVPIAPPVEPEPPNTPPVLPKPGGPGETNPTPPKIPDHLETPPFYPYNPSLLVPTIPNQPPPNTPVVPQKLPDDVFATPPNSPATTPSTNPTESPPPPPTVQTPQAPSKQLPGEPQP